MGKGEEEAAARGPRQQRESMGRLLRLVSCRFKRATSFSEEKCTIKMELWLSTKRKKRHGLAESLALAGVCLLELVC